jgi:predicted RNase H-like nuclease
VLLAAWPDAAVIGVDIPIGLPERPLREADLAAREFVGERRSSVFATFPPLVLQAPTYEEAKTICIERGWSQPSIQSYGMRHRIFAITALVAADERVVEVHPKVTFRELLGRTLAPKRTEWAGPNGASHSQKKELTSRTCLIRSTMRSMPP